MADAQGDRDRRLPTSGRLRLNPTSGKQSKGGSINVLPPFIILITVKHSAETKQKLREATRRQFADPEKRKRHAEAVRLKMADPEVLRRLSVAHLGLKRTIEARAKQSMSGKGKKRPPDTGLRIAAAARERWATYSPERRREIALVGLRKANSPPSSLERIVRALLDTLEIEYEANTRIGSFFVDILVPSRNLVIECDGTYWHSRPRMIQRDARKNVYLASRGYKVLRLPEPVIRSLEASALQLLISV